jgi:serine/threonine protein kinase
VAEDQYHATQMCGTRRYMAQEVFYGKPYGLPADVYSFSHVLWETATLEIPYKGRLARAHIRYTYKLKQRPRVRMKWPKDLKRWIKRGWCHKPESRMKMESICSEMRQYFTRKDIQIVSSKIN